MAYYIESTMGDPQEMAAIKFETDGTVSVVVGTQSNGQGHETAYAQVLHERLGVPFEAIRIVQGDTAKLKLGGGTGGSRSLTAEGMAIRDCADDVIERGRHYAAQELETAVADIDYDRESAEFAVIGTDRRIGILELAQKARETTNPPEGFEGGLDAEATAQIDAWTFPNGCHLAEVEVDPDTGVTQIVNYVAVDDFGVVLNPMLVAGQVHGGVVQGIGQALWEECVYDENGQLLTGSLTDYAIPRADLLPDIEVLSTVTPSPHHPLGVKGIGEAGTIASTVTVYNAVIDALEPFGVHSLQMPLTPERIWRAIHAQKSGA
jgi:aerobic carbon-monoxide dehydrogenase large subunit